MAMERVRERLIIARLSEENKKGRITLVLLSHLFRRKAMVGKKFDFFSLFPAFQTMATFNFSKYYVNLFS